MKRSYTFNVVKYSTLLPLLLLALSLFMLTENSVAQTTPPNKDMGSAIDPGVSLLLQDVNSPNPSTAANAISELKGVKMPSGLALPALIPALKNPSEFVRLGAINMIAEFGEKAAPALPSLVGALKDKDSLVREAAALAISMTGTSARNAIPDLAGLLGDESRKARDAAVAALAGLGEFSVPVLVKSLENNNPVVALAASEALSRIGAPSVEPLISLLRKGGATSHNASSALAIIGKPAVIPLIKLLRDPNPEISARAGQTLNTMGSLAIPDLIEALKTKN